MRYVCVECGKICDEDNKDFVINPDGEANCDDCYDPDDWFDEAEPDEPEEPESSAEEKIPEYEPIRIQPIKEEKKFRWFKRD